MSRRHPGWRALAEAVAPGARVTRLRRLTGGGGGTDAYDVTLDQAPRRVVVKLYPDGDGTASLEWSRLEFVQRVTAPVPEPIAAQAVKAGKLVRVLGGFEPKAPGVFLYYPSRHQMMPKLRAFIDHVKGLVPRRSR